MSCRSYSTLYSKMTRLASSALTACSVVCLCSCAEPPVEPVSRQVQAPVAPGTVLSEAEFEQTLQDTGARLVVVQVFMEACGPCMTEAIQLTKVEKEWEAKGVAILGMGMDETPQGPKAFFDSVGGRVEYPLYCAPWFALQQQVVATPTLFVFSPAGEQLYRTDPETTDATPVADVAERLPELLAGM